MSQTIGRIEEISFYSASLQEDVTLLVYLPVNYTPLHKHTVVIAQDGRDYFQLGKAHRVIERLRETEEIDRTIIVGIPYKNVHDRKEKYFPNEVKNAAYIRFLAHELAPYIDENSYNYLKYAVVINWHNLQNNLIKNRKMSINVILYNRGGRVE